MLKVAFMLCGTVLAVREKDNNLDVKSRELPCTLSVEYGQAVKKGESEAQQSFSIILKCSETVSDGRLMVPWLFKDGEFPSNIRGKDGTDQLPANEPVVVWTSHMVKENPYYEVYGMEKNDQKTLSYVNSKFTFTAKYGAEDTTDEVSVVIEEAPEIITPPTVTSPPMTGGDLPCVLTMDLTDKTAVVKIKCTQEVSKVRLITPPSYNNVQFNDPLVAGKIYTLMTLQRIPELEGQTFVVEAVSSSTPEPTKSNVVAFPGGSENSPLEPVNSDPDQLPCTLTSSKANLVGGGSGFTLSLKCTEKISDVTLKIPGYADRNLQDITPGKEWNLATYNTQTGFVGKQFFVEATWQGKTAASNKVVQPE